MNIMQDKKAKGFHGVVIRKLVASYLIIVMIPIILCGFLSKRSIDEAYHNELIATEVRAQQSANTVGQIIDNMNTVVQLLGKADEIYQLAELNTVNNPEKVNRLIDLRSLLESIASTVPAEGELIVFSEELNFIATTSLVCVDMAMAVEQAQQMDSVNRILRLIKAEGNAYDNMRMSSFVMPYEDGTAALATGNSLYIRSKQANICILFVVEPQQMAECLSTDGDTGYALYYADKPIVCSLENCPDPGWMEWEDSETVEDGKGGKWMAASALARDNSAVRVVALQPWQYIANRVNYIVSSLVILIMSVFILTLLLALLLAYANNKPFDKLLTMLFGEEIASKQIKYNWQIVNDAVRSLLTDNENLRLEMKYQNQGMRQNLLYGLISGPHIDRRAALGMLPKLGLKPEFEGWVVLIVCDDRAGSIEPLYSSMLVKKMVDRRFGENADSICIDTMRYAVIIYSDLSAEELRAWHDSFSGEIAGVTGMTAVAAGVHISSMAALADAYVTAQVLANISSTSEMAIFTGKGEMTSKVSYSVEMSDRIRQTILEGDSAGLLRCVSEISDQFVSADADALNGLVRALCVDVGSVLLRLEGLSEGLAERTLKDISELSVSNPLSCVSRMPYVLEGVLNEVCDMRSRHAASARAVGLGKSIMAFIDANITDPGLSLSMLSSEFELSESYISGLVKSETSGGFASYLEERRVKLACEALSRGDSVTDAATKAGYMSPHTFRRAFKKVMGINPSEYMPRGADEQGQPAEVLKD